MVSPDPMRTRDVESAYLEHRYFLKATTRKKLDVSGICHGHKNASLDVNENPGHRCYLLSGMVVCAYVWTYEEEQYQTQFVMCKMLLCSLWGTGGLCHFDPLWSYFLLMENRFLLGVYRRLINMRVLPRPYSKRIINRDINDRTELFPQA